MTRQVKRPPAEAVKRSGNRLTFERDGSAEVEFRVLHGDMVQVAVADGIAMIGEPVPADMIRQLAEMLPKKKGSGSCG